ncbi:beta-N-acetylhexosaminidase [Arcticibacter tournemirensis]|uniref:beta-N-acetylhexosaminidase n=1 Tax=Arcticibacter tournemirensis TaxID=699437 RepID=A0A4Q0MCM5_9SPHI|nr:family 20 glycosylhydrolase [Arcticibacter tournemirensis]RXF71101.1 beta-N-acetylhexosaminidase [Arcticibacter tournemirensis]
MLLKKRILTALFVYAGFTASAQTSSGKIAIIPEPVSIVEHTGTFVLPEKTTIKASSNAESMQVAAYLKEKLGVTGKNIVVSHSGNSNIELVLLRKEDTELSKEGYRLNVSEEKVKIEANQPAGLFYGVQTLLQLFPKEVESKDQLLNLKWQVPCATITDYPRFGWRGLMFDVARHFFTKEDVKQYIDQMARYKFNLLHLHLTDDEGWRIEIKSYPKLTQVGAWNVKKVGYFGDFTPPLPNEPRTYGGFYTQEDIKELVRYAKERFIDILPEIDVPGHSLAAVASYPELSCTPGADQYKVRSGEKIMDWSRGAPPIALLDNTLCPANEKVYEFLDKVVTEVAALFPFEYIHMGGDECPKNFWEKNEAIKALAKENNLKNMEEVQGYFEKRLEKIVVSRGKKFMGWDEILEGGLAPSAAVMSWRGMKGGTEAAKMKHEVVMSPTTFAYLDYMQGDAAIEPKVYASLRLNKAYQFEPLPDSVDEQYIKGGQANLWTEQIYNMRHAQYMTWPRAFAISESVWSQKGKKNWDYFFNRVEKHFARFDQAEIKYAPSVYEPIFSTSVTPDKQLQIHMSTEVSGLDIYYTFDNSFPDHFYPKYTTPLIAPKDAVMLKVITYRGNKPVGRMINYPIKDLQDKIKLQRTQGQRQQ